MLSNVPQRNKNKALSQPPVKLALISITIPHRLYEYEAPLHLTFTFYPSSEVNRKMTVQYSVERLHLFFAEGYNRRQLLCVALKRKIVDP